MRIGDLVTLSASGKKSHQNEEVLGTIGLLVAIKRDDYPFKVEWIGVRSKRLNADETRKYGTGTGMVLPMKRYEIKLAKNK